MSGRGPLKLKGGASLNDAAGIKKKKKKKTPEELAVLARADSSGNAEGDEPAAAAEQDIKAITRGRELKAPGENEDRRTEAEKRFEQRQLQLEKERLKKLASKTHRDRVNEYNAMLANLSEHHDIPRIGPG